MTDQPQNSTSATLHTTLSYASLKGGGRTARLTLNRPDQANAFSAQMMDEISAHVAALKNQNPMMGGRKKKSKTAKKYKSKSKSKQRGGILELGAFINEAAVPFSLLAAQQKFKGRRTKGYKSKSRRVRG